MKKVLMVILLFLIGILNINASSIEKVSDNMYILADAPTITGFGDGEQSCSDILGPTLTEFVKLGITVVRIGGAIIAIVNGMLKLIPAVISKDASALNKAFDKCVKMAIILAVICFFPLILNLIGTIFKFDMSCIA